MVVTKRATARQTSNEQKAMSAIPDNKAPVGETRPPAWFGALRQHRRLDVSREGDTSDIEWLGWDGWVSVAGEAQDTGGTQHA